ncbi:19273_t:CDS:1, partial [Gigaspora rosea]
SPSLFAGTFFVTLLVLLLCRFRVAFVSVVSCRHVAVRWCTV